MKIPLDVRGKGRVRGSVQAAKAVLAVTTGVFAVPLLAAGPSALGVWTQYSFNFPATGSVSDFSPMSAANLPNGTVLLWSANKPGSYENSSAANTTYYAVMDVSAQGDPVLGHYVNGHGEMFCTATTLLTDGTLLLTGGSKPESVIKVSTRPGVRNDVTFSAGPSLNKARSYNSATLLTDGNVFTIGGSFRDKTEIAPTYGNRFGETLDVDRNRWVALPSFPNRNIAGVPGGLVGLQFMESASGASTWASPDIQGIYRSDNHAWLIPFEASDGRHKLFHAGPTDRTHVIDPTPPGDWSDVGQRPGDYRMNGIAVRFEPDKLLMLGGSRSYGDVDDAINKIRLPKDQKDRLLLAMPFAYVADLSRLPGARDPAGAVTWTKLAADPLHRTFGSGVVLPGGMVLIAGGQVSAKPFKDDGAVMVSQLFDPAIRSFRTSASMNTGRTYHSAALLLPDATVLMFGGGACNIKPKWTKPCNKKGDVHYDYEIFKPPYLYRGSRPARPVVNHVAGEAAVPFRSNAAIHVTSSGCAGANCKMELIRMSSVTHGVNNDQLRIPMEPAGGDTWRIPARYQPFVLGGYYMLFAVDGGVPSISRTVRVDRV